jgi:hypothetical protein
MSAPSPETEANPHAVPRHFLMVLCGAVFGALPAGVCMTLVSEPGRQGSPIYGLLLPWSILPFIVTLVAGWRGRFSQHVHKLAWMTLVAAILGAALQFYAFVFVPRVADARKWFLFVPLWQWAMIAGPALRCVLQPGINPAATNPSSAPEDSR